MNPRPSNTLRATLLQASAAAALSLGLLGAAQAQDALKIGFIGTLSGPGGALGQDQYDAFMLAIEQRGGKLGDVPVTVIKEDDQLKPDVGVQAATKLLQSDKVDIITGVTFSNVMMAIHKPITDAEVFFIGSNAGPAPIAGKQCSRFYFSTSWDNDMLHEAGGQLTNDLGYKNVYVMAANYQAGRDAVSGFKRNFKGNVIDEVYTQVNQPDYSAEIAQLQAASPDAVYVFYPGGMGINFIKQYRQAGLLGQIPILSAATLDGTTLPALKNLAVGAITSAPYAPNIDNPQNKAFVEAFEKAYKRPPSMYAAQSYDAASLLDSALRKVKGDLSNKQAFIEALREADFQSVRGPFKFDSNHFPDAAFYRVDVVEENGEAVLRASTPVNIATRANFHELCEMK
ncbi:ABC transporter substrate-binding protein [Yanghanlia caeni]|uniref:ABC transporter substrate-binding protein n=1 Tax=Yanghanlia caeni TaxID=3064283 RepID=A0ABU1D2E4_9BURK|nr:ABC transporter substrate-binding protein [Alcaligenaceae bacterium LG-2]NGR06729.1 ABC transporter substrate-binding protein [bacterium SGD-2]HZH55575.1 ABC transporter substrate-binding protein [Burkholderiaceae bacterium]